jgi:2-polyprenyl-3-methyl-5-hydroxy-6-metoxy-1,4-benzoquinol methylase
VLDLGCGVGRLSAKLAALFDNYLGVDLDVMIAEASRRNPNFASRYRISTIQEFEYPSDRYDLVLSMACLGNACPIEDLPAVARGMIKATKPGGRLVLIDAFHTLPPLTRTCRITPRRAIEVFSQLGTSLVEWTGIHFVPLRLVLAQPFFANWPRTTRFGYAAGEALCTLAPRIASDYSVIVLRKP